MRYTTENELQGLVSPDSVQRYWPLLLQALQEQGQDTPAARIALAANTQAESRMRPVAEQSSTDPQFQRYEPFTRVGRILGNTSAGDGLRYRGRGFLQLTGRDNHRRIGAMIGVDLEAQPTLLTSDPAIAAQATVAYLRSRGAFDAAERGDWEAVRRTVQPGDDPMGMARFRTVVDALLVRATNTPDRPSGPVGTPGGGQAPALNLRVIGPLVGMLLALLALRQVWRR